MRDMPHTMTPTVRDLRARKRLTQAQLAARAGVHKSTVQRVEQGRTISLLNQQALADALGIERTELFVEEQVA